MSGVGLVPLTEYEEQRLAHCEAVVDRGLDQARNVYSALAEIRTRRLYKHKHGTFEEYAQSRFGISRSRAYQLIAASAVCEAIHDAPTKSGVVREILPTNERQMRNLSRLEPPQIVDAWDSAVDAAGGGVPTNKQVRDAVEEFETKKEAQTVTWLPPSYVQDAARRMGVTLASGLVESSDTLHRYSSDQTVIVIRASIGAEWIRGIWKHPVCVLHGLIRVTPRQRQGSFGGAMVAFACSDYRPWEDRFIDAFGQHGTIILPTDTDGVSESIRC